MLTLNPVICPSRWLRATGCFLPLLFVVLPVESFATSTDFHPEIDSLVVPCKEIVKPILSNLSNNTGSSVTFHALEFLDGFPRYLGTPLDIDHFSINLTGEGVDSTQTKLTFSCEDVSSLYQVEIHAWDPSGKTGFCRTQLFVAESEYVVCHSQHHSDISGTVKTPQGTPIPEIEIATSGSSESTRKSDSEGSFVFSDLLSGRPYSVKPISPDDFLNGVTTLDLLIIRKHILGVDSIDDPFLLIAADVDRNGTINTLDLLHLRKVILGMEDVFPNNNSWVFIPENFQFPDPTNVLDGSLPGEINIDTLRDGAETNFIGIKIGDMDRSGVSAHN